MVSGACRTCSTYKSETCSNFARNEPTAFSRASLPRSVTGYRFVLVSAVGLWNIAAESPDRTAAVAPDGRAVSYGELAAEANRIGRGLQALGLEPGDSVAILLPNSVTNLAVFFAAMQTGRYLVPVNWHLVGAGGLAADAFRPAG